MRCSTRNVALLLMAAISTCVACTAWASGGGSMDMPSSPSSMQDTEPTPEEKAVIVYDAGVALIKRADEALADADAATDVKKQQKAREHAKKYFGKAQKKFESAVELNPDMYQAWNYVGYSKRNLGDYNGALEAYDRALALNPRYLEAIEYRGHAYLGLNRLDDAKQAYLDLFASNPALAKKLLTAMQAWVGSHRGDAQGVAQSVIEDFAKWVDERDGIAANTMNLVPAGNAGIWH